MSTTKSTTPALLTPATEAEVSAALLRLATANYADAELVEHPEAIPPVGPEQVTYRRGPLEVEELGWSAGGAKVSQRIDVWVPAGTPGKHAALTERIGSRDHVTGVLALGEHARLGEVTRSTRQASLSDGTTVTTGTYSVEVFPTVPLIEGRSAEVVRSVLADRHRGREVGKVQPVEGTPERRTQRVELGVTVRGNVRPVMDELRGSNTAAGHITGVEYIAGRADHIGGASFATATPSHDRNVVQLATTLEWRER